MHEYWTKTDLLKLPEIKKPGLMFSQDDDANMIGVEVTKDGSPVTISGDVVANVTRQDGSTIQINGDSDGNKAWVVLSEDAYAVVGNIGVFLKVSDGDSVSTLCGVEAYVYKSR